MPSTTAGLGAGLGAGLSIGSAGGAEKSGANRAERLFTETRGWRQLLVW